MFENMTFENILQDVLDNAPDGIDTRQGSIFYDAVAGPCLKIAKLYTDIDIARKMASIATAIGDDLDDKADEYGVTRHAATPAKYRFSFEGTTPETGTRFYNDGLYFLLRYNTLEGEYYLEAEVPGESGNVIYAGTAAIPVNEIEGLKNAKFGEIYENGTDREKDESLRTRVREKIAGPAENGNKQHYKTWCESIDGIGHARIYPLWNGPNTVKAVLIDSSGRACSSAKIAEVQKYIDPATNGYTATVDGYAYTVGDGLGEGVANLGAHFTAVSAREIKIDVSFTADLASGFTPQEVRSQAQEAIAAYLKDLTLTTAAADDVVIRAARIGAIIIELDSVLDYKDLTLNGGTENIKPGADFIPVAGEVTVAT